MADTWRRLSQAEVSDAPSPSAWVASSGPACQSFSVITRLSDSTASAARVKNRRITSHKRAPEDVRRADPVQGLRPAVMGEAQQLTYLFRNAASPADQAFTPPCCGRHRELNL
jgi:hypothetical protein